MRTIRLKLNLPLTGAPRGRRARSGHGYKVRRSVAKVVVISGAGAGVGRATARKFVHERYDIQVCLAVIPRGWDTPRPS